MALRFRDAAIADLRLFVTHYENAFFKLYADSGLYDEDAIIENVRRSAHALFDEIFTHIETTLASKKVLGRKRFQKSWHELSFRIGSRLVIVYYSEEASVRWIGSVSIDRKPIIF